MIVQLSAATAASTTVLATPILIRLLNKSNVVDEVTERSSHTQPVPRGAGLGIVLGVAVAAGVSSGMPGAFSNIAAPVVAVTLFALLGFVDDLRSIAAGQRLIGQSVLAASVIGALGPAPITGLFAVDAVLSTVWIVGYVNVFNFMDGINGISGATAALCGASLGGAALLWGEPTLAVLPLAVTASACGFLPFNFPNAKAFLGDVGSYALGAGLAISLLSAAQAGVPLYPMILPFALYMADTTWTLWRRYRRGARLMASHREHTYQRLANELQLGHARVTLIVMCCTSVLGGIGFGVQALGGTLLWQAAGSLAALILMGSYLILPAVLFRIFDYQKAA